MTMAPVTMATGRAWNQRRPSVASLSSHIVCPLCRGYLIDATTITTCFHSFCRSCIVRHLKRNNFCPTCRTLSPATDICPTVKKLRSDRILQTLIYKLIPGLFEEESRRRKEYKQSNQSEQGLGEGVISVTESGRLTQEKEKQRSRVLCGGGRSRMASLIYAGHESINVCLQYCDKFPPRQNIISVGASGQKGKDKEDNRMSSGCRYLLCPAFITIGHLKKFLQLKFDLDENCEIDIFHSEENLPHDYTLVDLAYIFHCRKIFDITLQYVIWEKGTTLLSVEDLQRRSDAKPGPSSCSSTTSSSSLPSFPASFATSSTSSPVLNRRCRRRRTQLEILGIQRSNANENKPHLQLRSGSALLRTQPEATALTMNGCTSLTDNGDTSYGQEDECGALEKQIMTLAIRAEERGVSDDGEGALTEFGISGNMLSDVAHLEQSIVGFSKGYPNSDCDVSLDFTPTEEHLPAELSNSSEFSVSYNKPSESLRSISDSTERVQLENVRTKVLELVDSRISDLESVLFDEIGIEGLVDTGTFDDVSTGYRKTGYLTSHLPGLFHVGSNDENQRRAATSNDVTLFGAMQGIQSTPPAVRSLQQLTDADIDREIRSLAADLALRTRSENGCSYRMTEDEDTPTSPMTIPGDETPPEEEMDDRSNVVCDDDRPSLSNAESETILHNVSVGVGIGETIEDRAVASNSAGVFVNPSDEAAVDVPSLQHHERHETDFLGVPGDEQFHQLPAVSDHFIPSKPCHYAESSRSLVHEGFSTTAGRESCLTDATEARPAKVVQLNSSDTCITEENILLPVISADSQNCVKVHKENLPLTSKERVQNHQVSAANNPSRLEIVSSNASGDKMRSGVSGNFNNDSATWKETALSSSRCVSAVISEKDASNRNLESSEHGDTGSNGSFVATKESASSKISSESIISPSSTNITVSSPFPTITFSPSVSTSSMSAQDKLSVGTQTNPDLLRRYFKRKSKPLGIFTSPKTSSRRTKQQNRLAAIASPTPDASDTPNPSPSVYSISTAASQSPTSVRLNSYLSERQRLRHLRPVSPRPNASASSSSVSFASPSTFYPPIGINGAKSTLLITLPAAGSAPPPPSTAAVRPSLTIIGSNLSLNGCSVAGTGLTPILIQASGISQGLPLQLLIPTITSSIANRSTTTSSTTTTVTSTAAAKRETDTLGAVSSSTAEDDLPSAATAASISSDAGDSAIDSSTQSNSQSNSPELKQKLRGRFPSDAPTSRTMGSSVKMSQLSSSTPCQSTSRLKSNTRPDSKPRRMPSRLTVRNTAKSVETVGAPLARTGFVLSSSVNCTRLPTQQPLPASRCAVNQRRPAGSSRLESLLMDQVLSTKGGNHLSVPLLQTSASSVLALSSAASSVSVTFSQGASAVLSEGHSHSVSRTKGRERPTFCGWVSQSVKTPTTETHSISVRGKLDANATVVASSLSGKGAPIGRRFGSQALGMTSSIKIAERTLGNSVGNKYDEIRNEDGTTNRLLPGKILHLAPASLIHAILDQKLQQPDAELFDSGSSVIAADASLSSSRHASVLMHDSGLEMNGRQSVIATNQKTLIPPVSVDEERRTIEGLSSEVQPLLKSSAQNEHNTWDLSAFCRSRPDTTKKSSGKMCHDDGCNSERMPLNGCGDQRRCYCSRSQPVSKVYSSVEQNSHVDKSDRRRKVISSGEAARISPKAVDVKFSRCKVLSSSPSSSSSSSPCVVAWSGSAVESPISISSSVATTDSSSNPCPEDSCGGRGGGGGGEGEEEKGEEMRSMAVAQSAAPKGTTDQIKPGAKEIGQQKAGNHKSALDVGVCGGGLSRPQETDSECLPGACSDASGCPSATPLYTTTALTQSQQPQSIDDWMTARKLFWRASPGQATKCGAIALPKKVYAYLGSALSKEHLSARRLTAADDHTTCNPSQPSVPSNQNPVQDTTAPSTVSESLSTPPPTPFYLLPPSSSSEDVSAPPIKQLRLMCSGIPYASEATAIASNSPPAAGATAGQQPKRKPKKKRKQPTDSSECRRTPRIRKTEARGNGQKEDYAGTRLTCAINSFGRDHRLPVAEGRLLTR